MMICSGVCRFLPILTSSLKASDQVDPNIAPGLVSGGQVRNVGDYVTHL